MLKATIDIGEKSSRGSAVAIQDPACNVPFTSSPMWLTLGKLTSDLKRLIKDSIEAQHKKSHQAPES